MDNKKNDFNEFNLLLAIIISLIVTEILYHKFDIDVSYRGLGYLIFGIIVTIWYLITKIKK